MGPTGRFALFIGIVLSVWTGMHLYVFSRVFSLPAVAAHAPRGLRWTLFAILWLSYPMGRVLARPPATPGAFPVELLGALWMGVLFLGFVAFLGADVVLLLGRLAPPGFRPPVTAARATAAILAVVLSAVSLAQWLRGPRVVAHEVTLPGLPRNLDGLKVVQISDLHLGSLLGTRFLAARVEEVAALSPDLLVVTGDLVDSEVGNVAPLVPVLKKLSAPLGVWGVTGNHEFYAGLPASVRLFADAGIRLLQDGWAEAAPGLVLAGVDDLSARRQLGLDGDPVAVALHGRPGGATVLLSHSPLRAREAERLGAGLMLSGHTHGGQIWPFNFLSAIPYPFQAGRYEVGRMTLLVCRGTGTWGPPMRLFQRSEILSITLRSPEG